MERNFRLLIEYDGTDFHGWQRQPQAPTIQGAIETALATMTGGPIGLIGAGRTDAGVHASGQVANFRCDTRLSPAELQNGLNSLLPPAIAILDCRLVPLEFHARYDAKSKRYRYRLLNRPAPAAIGRQYAWHVRRPLDAAAMQAALDRLLGRHDFSAFEGAGSPRTHSVRTLSAGRVQAGGGGLLDIVVEADGFLRYMVRNIVGTLVAVGGGKLEPAGIEAVLASRDRRLAGPTAPARGLCLEAVRY